MRASRPRVNHGIRVKKGLCASGEGADDEGDGPFGVLTVDA